MAHLVVCHLVLNEMNTAVSLRLILTQDRPSLSESEDDRCAERFAALYPDTTTALGVWRALREDNLRLCASVSPEDRERIGQVQGKADVSRSRTPSTLSRPNLPHQRHR